jgi:hypothetical protein
MDGESNRLLSYQVVVSTTVLSISSRFLRIDGEDINTSARETSMGS